MLKKIGALRKGKIITFDNLTAQIDDEGAAPLIVDEINWLATQEGLVTLLGGIVTYKITDEKSKVLNRFGTKGKKFQYTLRERRSYYSNGSPIITSKIGTIVEVDQFGYPYHPDAHNEKQYYNLDGEVVTLTEDLKEKQILRFDLQMPIIINGENGKRINLSFERNRYAIADMDCRCLLFDQSGGIIDAARVMKFEKLIRGVINKKIPLKQCIEGGFYTEDLISRGREVVIKSLIKFDQDKAIETVSETSKRKKVSDEDRLKFKRENRDQAILECEINWVQQPLHNEFRRLAWDHSEAALGGRSVSITAALRKKAVQVSEESENTETEDIFQMMNDTDPKAFQNDKKFGIMSVDNDEVSDMEDFLGADEGDQEVYLMDVNQAHTDMEDILHLQEKLDVKNIEVDVRESMIRDAVRKLPKHRQEDLQALLKNFKNSPTVKAKSDEEMSEEFEQASIKADLESELERTPVVEIKKENEE